MLQKLRTSVRRLTGVYQSVGNNNLAEQHNATDQLTPSLWGTRWEEGEERPFTQKKT